MRVRCPTQRPEARDPLCYLATVLCIRTQYSTQDRQPEVAETCALWLIICILAWKNEQSLLGNKKREKRKEKKEGRGGEGRGGFF